MAKARGSTRKPAGEGRARKRRLIRVPLAPELPCYEVAVGKVISATLKHFAITNHPLLSKMQMRTGAPASHAQLIRGVGGEAMLKPDPISASIKLGRAEAMAFDLKPWHDELEKAGTSLGEQMMNDVVKTIGRITKVTGLEVDGSKYKTRVDKLLAGLEAVELPFDEFGNAELPDLVGDRMPPTPFLDAIKAAGPDAMKQLEEVVARKREKWLAQRSSRRLPDIVPE